MVPAALLPNAEAPVRTTYESVSFFRPFLADLGEPPPARSDLPCLLAMPFFSVVGAGIAEANAGSDLAKRLELTTTWAGWAGAPCSAASSWRRRSSSWACNLAWVAWAFSSLELAGAVATEPMELGMPDELAFSLV